MLVDVTTRTNGGAPSTGRLYLVDLAGSERVLKSGRDPVQRVRKRACACVRERGANECVCELAG